ncbi:hypothetical protein [Campylobacter felis]|uniref:hypothetical protein n=1 Tax=Campylobacter felis TaxID=2974565 RepID=UPI0025657BA2|nr:hypothetical protein [Campylobacter felis]
MKFEVLFLMRAMRPHKTMDTPLSETIAETTIQGEALSKELKSEMLDLKISKEKDFFKNLRNEAKKGEKSPIEMMNTLIFTNLSKFNASMEKITPLGEYRGNKLYGVKAGREIVIKIGNDVQNSIPLFSLSEFEIKLSLNANSRLKNAYEKLENEKSRDLNGVYQQLNELQLEKAELAVFLGRAEGKERQIISEFYDVSDIKENENDKYTMLENFLMDKYNKN